MAQYRPTRTAEYAIGCGFDFHSRKHSIGERSGLTLGSQIPSVYPAVYWIQRKLLLYKSF